MNIQPILENDHFLIRPLREEDRDQLFAVANDPMIWDQHPAKERATKKGFDQFFDLSMNSGGALLIIDKNSDSVIGSSRYELHEDDPWQFRSDGPICPDRIGGTAPTSRSKN
ncbi:GNAT family N-acetyltransferase [Aureitalea marina]|uniref:GNAT family N-acetyltransferase n=1 Tax=Aureitalea marina TaxID=930804 RepID=UPI000CF2E05B|nr:GNAT family N-acetyltransferase [Aureitalea marina]